MRNWRLAAGIVLAGVSLPALAIDFGDVEAGKQKAQACMACHAVDGSGNPQFPKLAGQHPDYLLQALKAYKSGDRQNAIMAGQVSNLSTEDLEDLAAFWASRKSSVYTIDYSAEQ